MPYFASLKRVKRVATRTIRRTIARAMAPQQRFLASLLTVAAKLKMRTVSDRGTEIGVRRELFTEIIPQGGIGVELGVYKGTLSVFILGANHPKRLHLVDPWWEYESQWHWAIGDTSTARSLAVIILVLQEAIEEGIVKLHVGGSTDVLETFEDDYLDWAYVDSTHAYEQTRQELEILNNKVKSTGLIAGDDWYEDETHRHHGVCKAVREFLAEHREYELVFCKQTQWALQQRR